MTKLSVNEQRATRGLEAARFDAHRLLKTDIMWTLSREDTVPKGLDSIVE